MPKEAARMFHEVIKIKPDYLEGYMNLGKLYEMMKEREKAVEMFEMALKLAPGDERILKALSALGAGR